MKNTKLPLNPKVEIMRWGPLPGKYFLFSDCVEAIFHIFPKSYKGHSWPKILCLFDENRMLWLNEQPELRIAGAEVFLAYMLPKKSRDKLRKQWLSSVAKLVKFERVLGKTDLKSLTNEELYFLGQKFYNLLIDFWLPTIPAELGNYGSDHLLEQKLSLFVQKDQLHRVMEILTTPERPSFYQQEEIALAESKTIKRHQSQFFWLQNSYNGTKVLSVEFFAKRKRKLPKDLKVKFQQQIKDIRLAKVKAQKQYRLPKQIMDISYALSYGVAWQDERKKQIFIYLHYKVLLLKEIARRKHYGLQNMLNLETAEAIESINKDFSKVLEERQKPFGFYCAPNVRKKLESSKVINYWKIYTEDKKLAGKKIITGTVVSVGKSNKVRGQVRIVFDPFIKNNFKSGNILVAPMTSPEYIFLMKKASAIITDTGGLTSHAAIVSRELNVPCIVGTKIATQALHEGDLVEVDASKGTITRIKK